MARRKTTTVEETSEAGPEEREIPDEIDDFERARLAFGQSKEVVRIHFARVTQDGTEESLETFEFDPETHNDDFIRTRYGVGKYRVRLMDKSWRWKQNFSRRIGDLTPASSSSAAAAPAPGFDPMAYFMKESERAKDQMNAILLALVSRNGGSSSSSGSDAALVKFLEAQAAQNTALLNAILSARPQGNGLDLAFKAFEIGIERVSELNAGAEGGWPSILRGLAKDLAPVLQQIVAQRAPVPGAPPPGGAPPPALPASTSAPAFGGPPELAALVARYAPIALAQAQQGVSPRDFAADILDGTGVAYHRVFDSLTSHEIVSMVPALDGFLWQQEDGIQRKWIDLVVEYLHNREWAFADDEDEENVPASTLQ